MVRGGENLPGDEMILDGNASDVMLTSSSLDSEAGQACPSKRLVKLPEAPSGHRLIVQRIKLKTIHSQEVDNQYILVCGRNRNAGYCFDGKVGHALLPHVLEGSGFHVDENFHLMLSDSTKKGVVNVV